MNLSYLNSDGCNKVYMLGGKNPNVIDCVKEVFSESCNQTIDLVQDIKWDDYDKQCRAIFNYVIDNITYREDPDNKQLVKTPARLIADGVGDCKSMAIFIGSCLYCLGIPFVFRFVAFTPNYGNQYTHVYIVAKPDTAEQLILDPVERDINNQPVYNYATPYALKKDIKLV